MISRKTKRSQTRTTLAAVLISSATALTTSPSHALAQDTDTAITQVPSTAAASPLEQLPAASRTVATGQSRGTEAPNPAQISTGADSRSPERQLTIERGAGRGPDQLYRGGKTAQPSKPLSRPSEGRTGAVARVGGDDRCNRPQTDAAIIAACARAIETRSAEFQRREAPVLTAEQRLLADQRLREPPMTWRNAARRLADTRDAEAIDTQGVAALVLERDADPARTATPAEAGRLLSAEAQALVDALVGPGVVTPPPQ